MSPTLADRLAKREAERRRIRQEAQERITARAKAA